MKCNSLRASRGVKLVRGERKRDGGLNEENKIAWRIINSIRKGLK